MHRSTQSEKETAQTLLRTRFCTVAALFRGEMRNRSARDLLLRLLSEQVGLEENNG
jgi:hypothetical protein